jgi:hypothetical protein
VTSELLLPVCLEVAFAIIDNNRVVHRLACKVLAVRMEGSCRNCMHIGFADVLGNYWDAELPDIHLFVIRCGHKTAAVLNEGYRVD